MKAKIQLALGPCPGDKTARQVKCGTVERQEEMTIELITKKQMELAGRLGLSGAYEEALDVLDRLIKLYPNYIGAIVYKGNLLDLWGLSGSAEEEESEKL
jgi:hypothetical protein